MRSPCATTPSRSAANARGASWRWAPRGRFGGRDLVVAIAEGCFATRAVADASHVARLPPDATFARAATVPFAFMTALFALRDCAALKPGETLLIHAAAGGVGSAAVQLAHSAGATVIATAGSDAKRAALRALGIAHVLDSRSLGFEAQVRELTAGRGVDVVLNSLAGDAIGRASPAWPRPAVSSRSASARFGPQSSSARSAPKAAISRSI